MSTNRKRPRSGGREGPSRLGRRVRRSFGWGGGMLDDPELHLRGAKLGDRPPLFPIRDRRRLKVEFPRNGGGVTSEIGIRECLIVHAVL